ncbi:MAG: cyclic nucleotide-binding domain-containing protein [bacterium]|nr:cyclic nucleotide-binding domain-containing protein [bacterium]
MLTTIEKVILLQNVDLFALVPTEQLAYLAAIAKETSASSGNTIYRENDPADSLFLVIEGSVRLHKGTQEITTALANHAFGTWALFDEELRLVTATALEDSRLLKIDREDFVEILADHVQISQGILKTLAGRLRNIVDRVQIDRSRADV